MEMLLYVYKIIYIDCSSKHIQFFYAKRKWAICWNFKWSLMKITSLWGKLSFFVISSRTCEPFTGSTLKFENTTQNGSTRTSKQSGSSRIKF